jgi:hypothetical protein
VIKGQPKPKDLRFYLKNKATRTGGMIQVIEHLPSKCRTLSSNPSTTKKKINQMETGKH